MKKIKLLTLLFLSLITASNAFAVGEVKFIYEVTKYSAKAINKIAEFYDQKGVGYHQYITNKDTIVDADVSQTEDAKSAIAVLQEHMSPNHDGQDSYIVNSELSAISTSGEDSAYGYYHADSGSAESSSAGGIYKSNIYAQSNGKYAMGIATEAGTAFWGASYNGNAIAVNENTIKAYGYDNASAYGIYAQGDWFVNVNDNLLCIYTDAGTAVGLNVDADNFSNIHDNQYYIETKTGSAYGISVKLSDDKYVAFSMHNENIEITNTDGGSQGYATGIFLGGEDNSNSTLYIDKIGGIKIKIDTQGDVGLGIGIDDINADVYINEIYDINIDINVERGIATGIHIDTEDFKCVVKNMYNIDINLNTHGNVYGYVLGFEIEPEARDDGAIAFYNTEYMNSKDMAKNFDYETISIDVESLGVSANYNGNSAYGVYLKDTDLTKSINFKSVIAKASGTPYAMYLNNSSITETLSIPLKSITSSLTGYGLYLENDSYIKNLAGSIEMEAIEENDNTAPESLTAIYLKDSNIDSITSSIEFNLTAEKLIAISTDNDSKIDLFDGRVYFSGDAVVFESNLYVYLKGKTPSEFDSVLFYNRDTQNSDGFTFGENAEVDLEYTNTYSDDYTIYGFYIVGEDNNIETTLDIFKTDIGVFLDDKATLTLNKSNMISHSNYVNNGSTFNLIDSDFQRLNSGVSYINVDNTSALNIDNSSLTSNIRLTNKSTLKLNNVKFDCINYQEPTEISVDSGSLATFTGDNIFESDLVVKGEDSVATIDSGSNYLCSIAVENGANLFLKEGSNTILTNCGIETSVLNTLKISNANYVEIGGNLEIINKYNRSNLGIYVEDETLINFKNNASVKSTNIYTDESLMEYLLSNDNTDINIKGDDSTISLSGNVQVNNGSLNIIDGNFKFDSQTWVVNGDINLGSKNESTGDITTSNLELVQSTSIDANGVVIYANSIDDVSTVTVADGVSLTFSDDFIMTYILSDKFSAQIGDKLLISDAIVFSNLKDGNINVYLENELLDDSAWEIFGEDGNGFGIQFIDAIPTTAVPEPSTYAMIFGALALGFAFYRKSQK